MVFKSEELEDLPEIPEGFVWIFVAVPEEIAEGLATELATATQFSIGTADPQPGPIDGPNGDEPDGQQNRKAEEPDDLDRR